MAAYYNEHDPFAAEWLRNLISAGHIAPGDVDERDIRDVRPSDLTRYSQCHFFAGIGVWSHSLRKAGWPDSRPVWTGSCPCQPFSAAGRGEGFADERHLWPAFFHLIEQCGPRVVFGEQVASKDGLAWLDLVQSDMEGAGYAFGALDLCAAGFGAPHIRQRLYFVANTARVGRRQISEDAFGSFGGSRTEGRTVEAVLGTGRRQEGDAPGRSDGSLAERVELADADGRHAGAERQQRGGQHGFEPQDASLGDDGLPGPTNGVWRDADWLLCRDGKWRPVRPGSFPLAHGAASRVGRLRAYGNAIVAEQAAQFISAFHEIDVGVNP